MIYFVWKNVGVERNERKMKAFMLVLEKKREKIKRHGRKDRRVIQGAEWVTCQQILAFPKEFTKQILSEK